MPKVYTPFEKEMESVLLKMRDELRGKIAATDADFRTVVGSSGIKDSIDLATDDMSTRKMDAISRVDSNRLKAVNQAIIRVRSGNYGICVQCGKKIPETRLRALPYAILCMDCKRMNERYGR